MSTDTTQERKTLRELRESKETLYAQNMTGNKITCNTDNVSFELDPHEIRVMPKDCLNEPGMQRLWRRKKVHLSDDPDMENQIELLDGGVVEGLRPVTVMMNDGTTKEVVPEVTPSHESRDFSVAVDTDPTSRTYGQAKTTKCVIGGEDVFQTAKQIEAGQPPLCPDHAGEAHRVMSVPQPDGTWRHTLAQVQTQPTQKAPPE